MTIWLDNHLSPALAPWLSQSFGVQCFQVRDLGLSRAKDVEIFDTARKAEAIFITKDRDFCDLVARLGPPPAIILLTCGNTSTQFLKGMLAQKLGQAIKLALAGEPIVELGAP